MPQPIDHIQIDDLPDECRQIAEVIGLDALLALSARMGGERIYIPRPERLAVAARDRAIRAAFTGRNYRDLAIQHGLTVRWIRAIVSGETTSGDRADEREDVYKQAKLF
jgi:Mor family transcriptional regulator